VVEAGVILSTLHERAAAEGLAFPLTFGARGSAMIGGCLSTNAGGSNVLRYGNARALCLGLEVVLADGRVMDLLGALHKDNSGYDLRDLFIGAEGTLGIITTATLKLVPAPRAFATALLALPSLDPALALLNRLQAVTGGAVEAFEYMPDLYMDRLAKHRPDLASPLAGRPAVTILVEIATTLPALADPGADGSVPLTELLQAELAALAEAGTLTDAVVAQTGAQRARFWAMRDRGAARPGGGIPHADGAAPRRPRPGCRDHGRRPPWRRQHPLHRLSDPNRCRP
jgi:FAD/FMN-containing dehydrogenase